MRELEPFADDAVACCGALSQKLFEAAGTSDRAELMALARWLRPVSVLSMRRQFGELSHFAPRAPRGVAFHEIQGVTAGYSMALSMLAGNRNAVRVSAAPDLDADLLWQAFDGVLVAERFASLRAATAILHEGESSGLERDCDLRIVAGDGRSAPGEVAFPADFPHAAVSDRNQHVQGLLCELTRPALVSAAA
jgi:hypothetical protein